jgi:cytochrome c553
MKQLLCTLVLLLVAACSASSSSDESHDQPQSAITPEQAAKEKFESILEIMELSDESLAPLFDCDWVGNEEVRKQLAFDAEMLTYGFAWLQTTLRPKSVEQDFIDDSKGTQAFMQKLASAARQGNDSVRSLFADPRATSQRHCGRCHDKYRDN